MKAIAPLVLALLCGCTSANRYGSARTLAKGDSAHVVGLDLSLIEQDVVTLDGGPELADHGGGAEPSIELAPVALPSYTYRYGAAHRIELGIGVGAAVGEVIGAALGVSGDLKAQVLRTRWVDASLAPTVGLVAGAWKVEAPVQVAASLPLLIGVNLGQHVTILPQAAIGTSPDVTFGVDLTWASLGMATQVRFDDWALQPGLQWTTIFGEPEVLWGGGLTVVFGSDSYGSGLEPPPPLPQWE